MHTARLWQCVHVNTMSVSSAVIVLSLTFWCCSSHTAQMITQAMAHNRRSMHWNIHPVCMPMGLCPFTLKKLPCQGIFCLWNFFTTSSGHSIFYLLQTLHSPVPWLCHIIHVCYSSLQFYFADHVHHPYSSLYASNKSFLLSDEVLLL